MHRYRDRSSGSDASYRKPSSAGCIISTSESDFSVHSLRQLLNRLESRQMSVNQGGTDVTTREIAVLLREIEQLKRTLSRLSR